MTFLKARAAAWKFEGHNHSFHGRDGPLSARAGVPTALTLTGRAVERGAWSDSLRGQCSLLQITFILIFCLVLNSTLGVYKGPSSAQYEVLFVLMVVVAKELRVY